MGCRMEVRAVSWAPGGGRGNRRVRQARERHATATHSRRGRSRGRAPSAAAGSRGGALCQGSRRSSATLPQTRTHTHDRAPGFEAKRRLQPRRRSSPPQPPGAHGERPGPSGNGAAEDNKHPCAAGAAHHARQQEWVQRAVRHQSRYGNCARAAVKLLQQSRRARSHC